MTEAGRNIGSVFGKSNTTLRDIYQDTLTQYIDHHHIYKQAIRKILPNSIYFDKQ